MKRTDRKRVRGGKVLLLAAFIIAAVILGALMYQKYRARHEAPPAPVHSQPTGKVQISLFFASTDARGLVRESREIEPCGGDTSACIQATLAELANGPLGDLAPTIPGTSTFNSVHIEGDTAVVDLGKTLAEDLPKGSSAEMTAVYSMVDTISFNFPAIKKVRFLLDGETVPTLGGHLELDKPLEPDFRLELQQG